MTAPRQAPTCAGILDTEYLSAALARAGVTDDVTTFQSEQLLGGRTGAAVHRLVTTRNSYVVKIIPEDTWRGAAMGSTAGGEARLWLSGVVDALPADIAWPVIDVAVDAQGRYWMMMNDVGEGIRPRGEFTKDDSRTLMSRLARMHGALWEHESIDTASLPDALGTLRVFALPLLRFGGREIPEAPWIDAFLADFEVMGAFAPMFFEVIGDRWSDELLDLIADEAWKQRLATLPATLVQGDLRRANIAFAPDHVALIDWEFAARAPAGSDLQWHCFLHYWAYAPDGSEAGDDCEDLFAFYARELGVAAGGQIDNDALRAGWDLGWIKTLAKLAYLVVDPLYPDGGSAEDRARVATLGQRAIQRALDIRASMG